MGVAVSRAAAALFFAVLVAGGAAGCSTGTDDAPPLRDGAAGVSVGKARASGLEVERPAYRLPPSRRNSSVLLRRPEGGGGAGSATVMLRLRVGVDGRVDSVEVERTAGTPALDSAARVQAREIGYFPAVDSTGAPVAAWIEESLRFEPPPSTPDTFPDRYYREQLRIESSGRLRIPPRQ